MTHLAGGGPKYLLPLFAATKILGVPSTESETSRVPPVGCRVNEGEGHDIMRSACNG